MTDDEALKCVAGAAQVIDYFGAWPSFHDAEILEVYVRRPGLFGISLHTMGLDPAKRERGVTQWKNGIVMFVLHGVSDMSLANYSSQNVIGNLSIEAKDNGFRLEIWGNTG